MSGQLSRYYCRPFQPLFADADFHLEQSRLHHNEVIASKDEANGFADQEYLRKCRASARACLLTVVAGLEAFCNSVYEEMKLRTTNDLPADWIPPELRKNKHKKWPVVQKAIFLPVLCRQELKSPAHYKENFTTDLKKLTEIVLVRNRVAHGRTTEIEFSLMVNVQPMHLLDDSNPENFYPLSDLPKDVQTIDYRDALPVYEEVLNAVRDLVRLLSPLIDVTYLRDQVLIHNGGSYTVQRESIHEYLPMWCQKVMHDYT